ncbi:chaperone modulator CbpM [Dysgonomonas sp. BGC7]|uniref:chaperone modulator CbpM n=1 Tax=Dysgonomonas sp. BGC7 TaxID=1658008 RepID=UPI00067F8F92|nr:chaperone modulator CbpM [Dysgonomonas sp. BGC7]MBD8387512.1 chaperone modulator CbpM [Dysgonomonas sp. BGC7]
MKPELIIIEEYCIQSEIEPDFIIQLENEGLIEIYIVDDKRYIDSSQLRDIEQYARWYYDLSINIEGIDVIRNLLSRMTEMQEEISRLREYTKLLNG